MYNSKKKPKISTYWRKGPVLFRRDFESRALVLRRQELWQTCVFKVRVVDSFLLSGVVSREMRPDELNLDPTAIESQLRTLDENVSWERYSKESIENKQSSSSLAILSRGYSSKSPLHRSHRRSWSLKSKLTYFTRIFSLHLWLVGFLRLKTPRPREVYFCRGSLNCVVCCNNDPRRWP